MHSYNLRVIDCPVYMICTNYINHLFENTQIVRIPNIIETDEVRPQAQYRYTGCRVLKHGGRVNASRADYYFNGCQQLLSAELSINTPTTTSTFGNCVSLTDLKVDKGYPYSLYIQHSNNYTTETLHAIIENLADMSTAETAPTLQMGTDNINKLDEEYKAMLEAKGWILK